MHKRTRLHAFAVISCLALGLSAQAQAPATQPEGSPVAPNREPIKIAAHSSRWDYPKEVTPPTGFKVHVVEKGDTLWDLGNTYLGNPFAWPQIWELNKWVKDPHWIYPGDPLIVDASRSVVPSGKEKDETPMEVAALRPDIRRAPRSTRAEYAYSFQDFIQLPFIAPRGAKAYFKESHGALINGHQDRTRGILSDGDTIYFDGGSDQGIKPGDRMVVTRVVTKDLYHPDDAQHRHRMGDVLQHQGIIRATSVTDKSTVAVIEHSLDGIYEGAYAVPYQEPAAIVANLRKDVSSPVPLQDPLAKIIYLRENRPVAAAGDMVIIDQGTRDGLKVGDILIMARRRGIDTGIMNSNDKEDLSKPTTNYFLGQMMVVHTEEATSTCRILRSKEEIFVGDVATR